MSAGLCAVYRRKGKPYKNLWRFSSGNSLPSFYLPLPVKISTANRAAKAGLTVTADDFTARNDALAAERKRFTQFPGSGTKNQGRMGPPRRRARSKLPDAADFLRPVRRKTRSGNAFRRHPGAQGGCPGVDRGAEGTDFGLGCLGRFRRL